jgi:hypothetical protein
MGVHILAVESGPAAPPGTHGSVVGVVPTYLEWGGLAGFTRDPTSAGCRPQEDRVGAALTAGAVVREVLVEGVEFAR